MNSAKMPPMVLGEIYTAKDGRKFTAVPYTLQGQCDDCAFGGSWSTCREEKIGLPICHPTTGSHIGVFKLITSRRTVFL